MSQRPLNTDSIEITPAILGLIAEIDEFKGAWRALGTLAPDRLSALRRVATIESIGSSTRIEGNRLSDADVERLLANLDITSFAPVTSRMVAGYAEAMELVFKSWEELSVTENHVMQLHRDLLVRSREGRLASRRLQDLAEQRRRIRRGGPGDRRRLRDRRRPSTRRS